MAYLRIGGYHGLLMPADAAMKVAALLQNAVNCHESFEGLSHCYVPGEPEEVEFKLIRANQLRARRPGSEDADDLVVLPAPVLRLPR